MKSNWIVLVAIALSCSSPKNEEVSQTNSSAEASRNEATSQYQTGYSAPTEISNFPDYSSGVLTEDPLEEKITNGIDELVNSYGSRNFLTYQSHYEREREFQGDYDTVIETEQVTETWFFDLSFKIKAFARKEQRDGEGRDSKLAIYLFSSDSLLAVSDRWDQDGQIGMIYHKKILVSQCPQCGIDVNQEAGAEGNVKEYLTRDDVASAENEVITSLEELVDIQQDWTKSAESDSKLAYSTTIENWPDNQPNGKPYSIEYTISADLHSYLKFLAFINLFNLTGNQIAQDVAQSFLDGEGPESYSSYSTVELLENESVYFLLYKKFRQVGQGVDELYAVSFTKDAQLKSNLSIGVSYSAAEEDAIGEDYQYSYDFEKHILTVTNITTDKTPKAKEKTVRYKLNSEGEIVCIGCEKN